MGLYVQWGGGWVRGRKEAGQAGRCWQMSTIGSFWVASSQLVLEAAGLLCPADTKEGSS